MIIGIGVDIIEISRIRAAIEHGAFCNRVFTPAERTYCEEKGRQRAASYAARFAGKEAVVKALGTGFTKGTWHDVEIVTTAAGCPQVKLHGYYAEVAEQQGVGQVYISLSHSQDNAVAYVVLAGGENNESCNS